MITLPKVTIDLSYPITIDGTETSVLVMRRPKVVDTVLFQKSQGTDADKEIKLFSNLCEVTPEEIGQLDMMDYAKLQVQYGNFMAPEPQKETSEESAQK
ncbi:MAG: phage tail assembly protein [Cloacibacillus sp.]